MPYTFAADYMNITPQIDPKTYWLAERASHTEKAYLDAIGTTYEEFCNRLCAMRSIGFEDNGMPFGGAVIDNDNFFHVAVLPEYYGRWGRLFYKSLKWAFSQSNTLYALVNVDNQRVKGLVDKQQWPIIWSNERFQLYKMTHERTRTT